MCDHDTEADNAAFLSRRQFGAMTGAAGVMLALPVPANALAVTDKDVVVTTPDGQCDAYFTAPGAGKYPGVLIWPDIMGLRPAFRAMADRLAQSGYAVLVINPFYRALKGSPLAPGESFDQPAVRAKLIPLAQGLTAAGTVSDATAFVAWLDAQKRVDTKRGIATTGYCMGGPLVFRTAAAIPARVRAAATFHGGGLVGDKPDSPNKLIPQTRASFLIAIAANDDAKAPNDKLVLKTDFAAAGPAEIEVYAGTMHGWCPPDSKVYDKAQADRAWERMLALFKAAL